MQNSPRLRKVEHPPTDYPSGLDFPIRQLRDRISKELTYAQEATEIARRLLHELSYGTRVQAELREFNHPENACAILAES